jgi:hypothetical protein
LLVCVVCLGCQVLTLSPEEGSEAAALWGQGQAAMRAGQPQEALAAYQRSLAVDPAFTRNHLSMAAACLEMGQDADACTHLAAYVTAHPEHLEIRAHYAELLVRLRHGPEGRAEYEQLLAQLQEQGDKALPAMIHAHSRLMETAEAEDDDYAAHLHRGIGLYLLARKRAAMGSPEGELSVESLLCKAAADLNEARTLRPEEARPCWYLYVVWTRLAQQQPAQRCLHAAGAAASFTFLTPAEQRSLELACPISGPLSGK